MAEDKNKLPKSNTVTSPKTIRIGSSEFNINPPDLVKEADTKKTIETFEKALEDKVFSGLEKHDSTDR